jgi:hypothetical protein
MWRPWMWQGRKCADWSRIGSGMKERWLRCSWVWKFCCSRVFVQGFGVGFWRGFVFMKWKCDF